MNKRAYPTKRRLPQRKFVKKRKLNTPFSSIVKKRNHEKKYTDQLFGPTTIATGGTQFPSINTVPQGVTENDRIGKQITIVSLSLRGYFTLPSAGGINAGTDILRYIVYVDRQNNSSAGPAVLDILETADINASMNMDNAKRFWVICDQYVDLNAPCWNVVGTATNEYRLHFHQFKKLEVPIIFSNTAASGVIGTITSNNMGILMLSTNGVVSTTYTTRIRFFDE